MRISILSLFIALAVVVAGPLAFSEETAPQEQVSEQEAAPGPEALSEASDTTLQETQTVVQEKVDGMQQVEIQETEIIEAEAATEDCANGADDDGDEKVDCDDSDCAGDPGCKSGY